MKAQVPSTSYSKIPRYTRFNTLFPGETFIAYLPTYLDPSPRLFVEVEIWYDWHTVHIGCSPGYIS